MYLSQTVKNVYISSKQRQLGENPESFTVIFNPSIDRCKSVQVVTAEIPQTWTPFDYFNCNLSYTIDNDSTVYNTALPTNKYYFNMSDLALDIQTALNEAETDSNVGTDYVFRVSFTESMMSFLIRSGVSESRSFCFKPCLNSAYSMLGLSNFDTSTPVTTYQCPLVANLQKTTAVYISCSSVPAVVYSTFPNGERILAKIPVTKDVGNILCFQDTSESNTPLGDSYISEMRLTLLDDRGIPLSLNGAEWSLELAFSY